MNIVNLMGLIWMMLTWSLLKLVRLPEDKLLAIRSQKKKKKESDTLSNSALKSTDRFNDNSVANLKMDLIKDSRSVLKPEKVD
jgi:hypothetical protein